MCACACVCETMREREKLGLTALVQFLPEYQGRMRKVVVGNGCGVTSKELFHTCWNERELSKTQSPKGRGGLGQERAASRKGSCNNSGCNI